MSARYPRESIAFLHKHTIRDRTGFRQGNDPSMIF